MGSELRLAWAIVGLALSTIGLVAGIQFAAGAGVGISLTILLIGRQKSLRPRSEPVVNPEFCRDDPGAGHLCTLPADGHTMHLCAFGDCEWGHR